MAETDPFSSEALASKESVEPEQGEQEAPVEQAEETTEASAEEKFLEDRFGGDPLKAAKSYMHLEDKLTEQGQELGQMRQAMERMAAVDEEPDFVYDDDDIAENPAQVAEDAWNAGDNRGVQKAWAEWKEVDPAGAAVWATNKQIQQMEQNISSRLQSSVEPLRQHTQQDNLNAAYAQLSNKYEDFNEFYNSGSYGEVLDGLPSQLRNATAEVLQNGDQTSIASALEYIYSSGKGRETPPAEDVTNQGGQQRQTAAVLDQERGRPSGGSGQPLSDAEARHAMIKGQVTATDEPSDEPMFVTAARHLRASRHLSY